MKKVLSISLGSSTRDHTTEAEFLGEQFWISRQGTDGDFEKAVQLYYEYDGKVDAFGVGGTEFYQLVNGRRYYWRESRRIRKAIKISKVGDGNGLKHLLAPRALQALEKHGITLEGKKALQMTSVDRYGMARALVDAGCETTFGDFIFALGIPLPVYTLRAVHLMAALLLPILTQLPFSFYYAQGEQQDKEPGTKFSHYYEAADVITGDFIQVWSHLPDDLTGKIVITNTTTARNVEELRKRNLHILVTTTPRLEGRSFGTNVMEAVCRCLIDKPDDQITQADIVDVVERIPLKPQVHVLNPVS
jgi:hypothetical protein